MAATWFTGRPVVDREAPPRQAAVRGTLAQPLLALATYCALSALLFGRQALGDVRHVVEGFGQAPAFYGHDQSAYVWSLAWAARALTHAQNPFLTHEIFAPGGYNLAWAASILGPGLLLAPVTLAFGAVASYNLLALAAPATAAWTAFLLCRHLSGRAAPAFAGGLLFGFGTYESAEMVNHVNLALVALVPLAALLVLRRHDELTSRGRFILALGLVLALQFWTSTEVFASMAMFGGLAFMVAALLADGARRPRIWTCALETLGALALALVLAGPYLFYALRYPNPVSGISTADAGADLANFAIPSEVTWLHGSGALAASAAKLRDNITEQLAYLGVPLILLLGAYAVECRRSRLARCLLAFIALAVVLSLGAHVFVDGSATGIALPWSILGQLPLLRFAGPGRFVLYAWLAAAIAVSCWLGRPSHARARWATFAVVVVSLAPNLTGVPWGTRVEAPRLLSAPALARYVPADSTVLALPFGIAGDSMFWQVQADFRFRLAGGYVSVSVPAAYQRYIHLIRALAGGPIEDGAARQLCGFLHMTGSSAILLREGAPGLWVRLLRTLRVRPRRVGGFSIYVLGAPGGASGECVPPRFPAPRARAADRLLAGMGEGMLARNQIEERAH
jgi:hypothetical protein